MRRRGYLLILLASFTKIYFSRKYVQMQHAFEIVPCSLQKMFDITEYTLVNYQDSVGLSTKKTFEYAHNYYVLEKRLNMHLNMRFLEPLIM